MESELTSQTEETTATIARELGETDPTPLQQIQRIVERLGADAAFALLRDSKEIESHGGMLTDNGKRQRTPGGVFFKIVKERIGAEDRAFIFPGPAPRPRAPPVARPKGPPAPPFQWEDRLAVLDEILKQKGAATTVKITLIGRPGKIVEKGNFVATALQSEKAPALPKGLPTPPSTPTTFIVFVARKHWAKVAEAIKNPDDMLIVEGYPVIDVQAKGISVFASNVTTKMLQAAKRQAQGE